MGSLAASGVCSAAALVAGVLLMDMATVSIFPDADSAFDSVSLTRAVVVETEVGAAVSAVSEVANCKSCCCVKKFVVTACTVDDGSAETCPFKDAATAGRVEALWDCVVETVASFGAIATRTLVVEALSAAAAVVDTEVVTPGDGIVLAAELMWLPCWSSLPSLPTRGRPVLRTTRRDKAFDDDDSLDAEEVVEVLLQALLICAVTAE